MMRTAYANSKLSAVNARVNEPDKKWYWLAQAAKYQVQANQKVAFQSEEPAAPDTPEIKLVQWSHVRDERRVMDPLPDGRPIVAGSRAGSWKTL